MDGKGTLHQLHLKASRFLPYSRVNRKEMAGRASELHPKQYCTWSSLSIAVVLWWHSNSYCCNCCVGLSSWRSEM